MKSKLFFGVLVISAIAANIFYVIAGNESQDLLTQFLFIFPLIGYYFPKLPKRNLNLYGFLICISAANLLLFYQHVFIFNSLVWGYGWSPLFFL